MATKSRMKRRAFRTKKRARRGGSTWFNLALAVIFIVGVPAVLISRHPGSAGSIGPKLKGVGGKSDHWHAALGVNICGKWQPGTAWPNAATIGRADTPNVYAGLHTHVNSAGVPDGVIHLEPQASEDAGRNATLGRYMKYGGWKLNATSIKIWQGSDGKVIAHKNGDKCGSKPGVLRWSVGAQKAGEKVKMVEKKGNPATYKLFDQNVVAIYFVPADEKLEKLGDVPSISELANAKNNEGMGKPTTSSPLTPPSGVGSSTSSGATTTTSGSAPSSSTAAATATT